jgi:hypothetical protein
MVLVERPGDVIRPDPGVDVTLARPHLHLAARDARQLASKFRTHSKAQALECNVACSIRTYGKLHIVALGVAIFNRNVSRRLD